MRFMVINKSNEANEAEVPPSRELIEAVEAIFREAAAEGIVLAAEGVYSSRRGARITFQGGQMSVTDGPFAEAKDLIAGFVIINVPSREAAIEWSKRYARVLGDVDLEIRQVVEQSDLEQA